MRQDRPTCPNLVKILVQDAQFFLLKLNLGLPFVQAWENELGTNLSEHDQQKLLPLYTSYTQPGLLRKRIIKFLCDGITILLSYIGSIPVCWINVGVAMPLQEQCFTFDGISLSFPFLESILQWASFLYFQGRSHP